LPKVKWTFRTQRLGSLWSLNSYFAIRYALACKSLSAQKKKCRAFGVEACLLWSVTPLAARPRWTCGTQMTPLSAAAFRPWHGSRLSAAQGQGVNAVHCV